MKKICFLAILAIAVWFSSCSENQQPHTLLLDFDQKTVRVCFTDNSPNIFDIETMWDKNWSTITQDPENPDNNVLKWQKDCSKQLYGGVAIRKRDHIPFETKAWKSVTYRLNSSEPFTTSILKMFDVNDKEILASTVTITADKNKWYRIVHEFDENYYKEKDPFVFFIMPGAGDDFDGFFLIDDIRLE
jgi:hypothetical protein